MQTSIVILALVGCAVAFPQRVFVPIVSRSYQFDPSGQFQSTYQSADGATVQDIGFLKRTNDGQDNVVAKQGSFSYTSPEGIPVQVSYIADEYGFKPTGNVLPVAQSPIHPTF